MKIYVKVKYITGKKYFVNRRPGHDKRGYSV
jgi:hypothetical protein